MADPVLELTGVTHHRGRRRILDAIDLRLDATETVALLGPNGAGKSTLLRIAATIARPTAGGVRIAGLDAREHPEAARRSLGVLTQAAPLYDELSPMEHLALWHRLRALPAAPLAAHLAAWGLAAVAHRPCGALSRGQRQRAAAALAEAGDPPVLLLDEPFAALDPEGQAFLESRLAARRGRKATLVVLQDEAQARRLADRVLRLRHHRLEAAA